MVLVVCRAHLRRKVHEACEQCLKVTVWFFRQIQSLNAVKAVLREEAGPALRPPSPSAPVSRLNTDSIPANALHRLNSLRLRNPCIQPVLWVTLAKDVLTRLPDITTTQLHEILPANWAKALQPRHKLAA